MKLQRSQMRFVPGERIFDPIVGCAGRFIEYLPEDSDYACRVDLDRFGTTTVIDIDRLRSLVDGRDLEEFRRCLKFAHPLPPGWRWLKAGDVLEARDTVLYDNKLGFHVPARRDDGLLTIGTVLDDAMISITVPRRRVPQPPAPRVRRIASNSDEPTEKPSRRRFNFD